MEETANSGRRRGKGAEATARAGALERLKALRRPGSRRSESAFQIKMEAPIYDTVAEDDYAALVAKRREAARDFIVDDDGLGYGDEGEEEDWEQNGLPPSSDESDKDSEKPKKKKAEKKDPAPKKPSSGLSAAAALMGKQRLSSMFTSSVFKKSRDDKAKGSVASESIVDDVIAEFAPDETDRVRRRRGPSNSVLGVRNSAPILHIRNEQQRIFANPVVNSEPTVVLASDLSTVCKEINDNSDSGCLTAAPLDLKDENVLKSEMDVDRNPQQKDLEANGSVDADAVDNGIVKLEAVKSEEKFSLNAKVKVEGDPALSASAGWKAVRGGENGHGGCDGGVVVATDGNSEEKSDFELDSDGSLPFYMIDAYEEIHGANTGTLYLFGKVLD